MKNRAFAVLFLFASSLSLNACDPAPRYIPEGANLITSVERNLFGATDVSFSVLSRTFERRSYIDGDTLVFGCPCYIGSNPGTGFIGPIVENAPVAVFIGAELRLFLPPSNPYNSEDYTVKTKELEKK